MFARKWIDHEKWEPGLPNKVAVNWLARREIMIK